MIKKHLVWRFMILIESRKENKHMGITCKPVSKMQSIMRKMENQLEAEKKDAKEKKETKKNKKS